ncbi:unnamed protein product [Vicia faba]|uniref:Uncharacterized protein n=1 Tax=Vicia faba TaxID=3906 RepID=A0AAV0ZQP8_VICFA|nr:unnamed protein product [Vicia faba]
MIGKKKRMNAYVNEKDIEEKSHEQDVVVIKSYGVHMMGIMIRGKFDGYSRGVSSISKPKIKVFNNPPSENVINVTQNVELPSTETSHENPMHDAPTHSEPKEVGENVNEDVNDNVNKDVTGDLNEDEFVREDVSNDDNQVMDDDIVDEVLVVRKTKKVCEKEVLLSYLVGTNNKINKTIADKKKVVVDKKNKNTEKKKMKIVEKEKNNSDKDKFVKRKNIVPSIT